MEAEPMAKFRTISYAGIIASDALALSTLHSAAVHEGFFFLDLTDAQGLSILSDISDLMSTSEKLFDLSLSEKMLFDTNKLGALKNYGYKPMGRNTGLSQSKRDGHELFLTPSDVLFGLNHIGGLECPAVLLRHIDVLTRFAHESHQICLAIMNALGLAVGIEGMAESHRPECSSTSAVALLKYPYLEDDSDFAGHIPHTDVGSLTLLFCDLDGLQAMHPISGEWENVTPCPGHAVVNIGDSLHHLSNRVLKSAFHRVLPHTTVNNNARYSVIYFMRPELTATFVDENGKEWKSLDWHKRKFDAFREESPTDVQHILDGRV